MSKRILVVGDAPSEATGLGRIARELSALLHESGWRVAQLGINHDPQSSWPWPTYALTDHANWGFRDLPEALERFEPEVVFTVWDPYRCFGLLHSEEGDPVNVGVLRRYGAELWGYFPVDAVDPWGGFGGPPAEVLRYYKRILAYGGFGAQALLAALQRLTPGEAPRLDGPITWLPHGLSDIWQPLGEEERKTARAMRAKEWGIPEDATLIGCVAANQPRKDFGLLFATWSRLRALEVTFSRKFYFWLHTDRLEHAWSVTQLAGMYRLVDRLRVSLRLDDAQLREWYACCDLTLAPGLGEGFGYPILESQACGVPVLHGDYGGGAEWVPVDHRVPRTAYRLEGLHGLVRPVFDPSAWTEAALRTLDEQPPQLTDVSGLRWKALWQEWRQWFEGKPRRE